MAHRKQTSLIHHYIPTFYLKRWAIDGKIVEFSKPYQDRVVPKRVHPQATGFMKRLYEMQGMPAEQAQSFEDDFLRDIDTKASHALEILESYGPNSPKFNEEHRRDWVRFLLSLEMRTPEDIQALKAATQKEWFESISLTKEQFKELGVEHADAAEAYIKKYEQEQLDSFSFGIIRSLILHKDLVENIIQMHWSVRDFKTATYPLLTGDRPLLMPPSLSAHDAYIVIPIGPRKAFCAFNNIETMRRFYVNSDQKSVKTINEQIVSHARKLVFSDSDRQLSFVQNHMGMKPVSTISERLVTVRNTGLPQINETLSD